MKKSSLFFLLGLMFLNSCVPAQRATPIIAFTATTTVSSEIVQMKTRQSGNWTIYIAPEWNQQKEPVTISSLAVAADGTLWFGTTGGPVSIGTGAYHFDGKTWSRYTTLNSGLPADEVSSIAASPDDTGP